MASSSFYHKFLISYDGGPFYGWQKTEEGPSVQETVEAVLEKLLNAKVTVEAASRTDRGVHAVGQVAAFASSKAIASYPSFQKSLNALLPPTIRILHIEETAPSFHPTLDARAKEYHYHICSAPVQPPKERLYSWHYPYPLCLSTMQKAAEFFIGEHDFSAFTNTKKNERYASTIRRLDQFLVIQEGSSLIMKLRGQSFLYKMVRNLVGTVVYVGCGKIKLEELPHILHTKDRRLAGVTAPAHGLWLNQITYQDHATEKRPLLVS